MPSHTEQERRNNLVNRSKTMVKNRAKKVKSLLRKPAK